MWSCRSSNTAIGNLPKLHRTRRVRNQDVGVCILPCPSESRVRGHRALQAIDRLSPGVRPLFMTSRRSPTRMQRLCSTAPRCPRPTPPQWRRKSTKPVDDAAGDSTASAIIAHPDEPENYLDFATLFFAHGSYSVGIDTLNSGLSSWRIPPRSTWRARLYGQNGDYDRPWPTLNVPTSILLIRWPSRGHCAVAAAQQQRGPGEFPQAGS